MILSDPTPSLLPTHPWGCCRPYLTRDFLLDQPPKAPSRAVAKLFGIDPGDAVLIDYDRRGAVGGSTSDLRRSGDRGSHGRRGEAEAGGGMLEALPEAMQEELLLEDLLYALMGFAGRCVVCKCREGGGCLPFF